MTFAQFARLEGAIYVTALLYLAVALAWALIRLAIKAHRYQRLVRAAGGEAQAMGVIYMLEADQEHRAATNLVRQIMGDVQ